MRIIAPPPAPRRRGHRVATAAVPQPSIPSVGGQQLVVGAAFGDPAVVEHDDLVGSGDGVQSMRDHQHRALLGQPVKCLLHKVFRLGVGERGGLVEDQHAGVGQDRAGDRQPLPFPTGQAAGRAQHGVVAVAAIA